MEVYKITNTVNGKVYIGSCKDSDKRFKAHKQYIRHNTKGNQLNWYKEVREDNDVDNLVKEVIEKFSENISNEKVKERENYWINYYWELLGKDKLYNMMKADGVFNRQQMINKDSKDNDKFIEKAKETNKFRNNGDLAWNKIESIFISFYRRYLLYNYDYSKTIISYFIKVYNQLNIEEFCKILVINDIDLNILQNFKTSNEEFLCKLEEVKSYIIKHNITKNKIQLNNSKYLNNKDSDGKRIFIHYKIKFDDKKFSGFSSFCDYLNKNFGVSLDRMKLLYDTRENNLIPYNDIIPNFTERYSCKFNR